jgi:hypothetical protein
MGLMVFMHYEHCNQDANPKPANGHHTKPANSGLSSMAALPAGSSRYQPPKMQKPHSHAASTAILSIPSSPENAKTALACGKEKSVSALRLGGDHAAM